MSTTKYKALLKGVMVFAILAGGIALFRLSGLSDVFDTAWIDANIRGHGMAGYGLFLLLAVVCTGLGFPRQVVSFFGGYAFGAIAGSLWATLGATIGCALVFSYARVAGRGAIERRYGNRVAKLNAFLRQSPFQMSVVIRLLPVGSNILTNLVAGVSAIPALAFIGGSSIGYFPQMLIFSLLGSGVHVDPVLRTSLSAVLLVVSSLLGYRLFRKYRLEGTVTAD